jgi:hypothetical protein
MEGPAKLIRAVVLGHSHTNAIAQAAIEQRRQDISVHRLHAKDRSEEALSTGEAVELVSSLGPDSCVFLAVLGAYHNVLGLLRAGQDFDFLVHGSDIPDPNAQVRVPHRAIVSAFAEQFARQDKIENLIAAAKCPVHLLSAPPPKRSNDFILQRFMGQKKQVYRGRSVKEVGIERAESRLKLWLLEERLMADWARSRGMQFLPPPPAAFDDSGFLREDCYSEDVTHANARYGALVIDQITAIIENRRERALHG